MAFTWGVWGRHCGSLTNEPSGVDSSGPIGEYMPETALDSPCSTLRFTVLAQYVDPQEQQNAYVGKKNDWG